MQLSHIEGKQPEIVQISWYLECWFIFDDMLINTKSNLPFMGSLRGPSKRPPGRSSPMRHHFYQDRHHHHIYIIIISTIVGHWWHTMTYINTLFIIWYHSRYQNIDHPPRLKCGSQNACFCQGWSITYPRAVNQLCACSLFQKQVCIDWSKSDPSDSISILWKTNSEVCLVFMSSVVATSCKTKLTPCHSTSPAPQPLCLSLLLPCLAHQAEVSYSQDNLLCRIGLNRNSRNQKQ